MDTGTDDEYRPRPRSSDVRFTRDIYRGEQMLVGAGAVAEVVGFHNGVDIVVVNIHEGDRQPGQQWHGIRVPRDALSVVRMRPEPRPPVVQNRPPVFQSARRIALEISQGVNVQSDDNGRLGIAQHSTGHEVQLLIPNSTGTRGVRYIMPPEPQEIFRRMQQHQRSSTQSSTDRRRIQRDVVPTLRSEMATVGSDWDQTIQQDTESTANPSQETIGEELSESYIGRVPANSPATSGRQENGSAVEE